ncbi:MAG: hypothetical protein A3J29_02475 [Acidobacteria bacterium RIFCSPLOWO2_12_FULL_67_14b]|nr:MAG: hypothetical protein A3J29_02475 [Acidobacteria bacterium RIFCSPLOWO2_12_FULL_67_14b]
MIQRVFAFLMILSVAACGPGAPAPSSAPAPAATAPAPAPKPAAAITLLEPADGASAGHIDLFRWSAADGADGYIIRILGSDGRVVFESPLLTATEAHLPKTVGLEPEAHTWSVTARKAGEALVASPVFKFTITP